MAAAGKDWWFAAGVAGAAAAAGVAAGLLAGRQLSVPEAATEPSGEACGADGARGKSGMPWDKHGIDRTIELGEFEDRPGEGVLPACRIDPPKLPCSLG